MRQSEDAPYAFQTAWNCSGLIPPDIQYLKNTLTVEFGVGEGFQDEFYTRYQTNLAYLKSQGVDVGGSTASQQHQLGGQMGSSSIILGESKNAGDLVAFVAMPFSEKTGNHAPGYFDEVLKHLITPAAVKANFNARTAKKPAAKSSSPRSLTIWTAPIW